MAEKESILSRLNPRSFPIALKITLGLAAFLLISSLFASFLFRQIAQNTQVDLALRDLQAYNRIQALRVTESLQREIFVLTQLSTDSRVERAIEDRENDSSNGETSTMLVPNSALGPVLDTFMQEHGEFDVVAVMDNRGHVLSIGIDALPEGFDAQTVPTPLWSWYLSAWNDGNGATYVTGQVDDPLAGKEGIHIQVPVYGAESSGQASGIIYAVWNMQNLQAEASANTPQMLIVEQDKTVILAPAKMDTTQIPSELMGEAKSGTFLSDNEWLYSYVSMGDLDISDPIISNLPWVLATRASARSAQTGLDSLVDFQNWVIGAISILAIVLTLFLARYLISPLNRVTNTITEIKLSGIHIPIPQFAPDEIGRLSRVVSQVIGQLLNRVEQLRAAVQVSHTTMMTLEIDKMLGEVAQSLSKHFNYSEVRVFLVDASGKRARLQAATGDESERLLQAGFRVEIDGTSLVGRSMMLNELLIGIGKEEIRDISTTSKHSEMVLPLQINGEITGAIHLIASRVRDFSREDTNILSLIAEQLSAAIQNARLFEQSAANLAEIEALNRRLTRQAWEEFMGEGGALRHTLDPDAHWPQTSVEPHPGGDIKAEIHTDADGRQVLAAPLVSRGETVGMLAVTRPAGETWTRDEALLLESIAARMGIIAESIRLVEESTQRVEREQRVNEVSANLLQRASSVDTVLRSALNEISGALGSDRISLRLGGLPARDGRQIAASFGDDTDGASVSDVPGLPGADRDRGITNV